MISEAQTTSLVSQLADVIRDVFNCPDLAVTRETSSFDVDGWDSLSHTVLLLRVESSFGVRLPLERTGSLANVGELADLVRSLVDEGLSQARRGDRGVVMFHGNCQMQCSYGLLKTALEGYGFEVVAISTYMTADYPLQPEPEHVRRCSVFIEQVSSWEAQPRPAYEAELPTNCRRLRIPALLMKTLWPFHKHDPRNGASAWGKHPYGDALVMRLLRESTDPDEVFRRYMETDIRKLMDLDRFHEMVMAEAVASDKLADVPLAPTLEQNFRVIRLFDAINHPSHEMVMFLRDIIASFILEEDSHLPRIPRPFEPLQVPVHPQVIEHFRLQWAAADTLYAYHGKSLTFEQWLHSYIAFD